jgi:hypothetical protein
MTDSKTLAVSLVKADSLSLADAIAKSFGAVKADSFTLTDSSFKTAALVESDSFTLSEGSSKSYSLVKSDTISLTDFFTRTVGYSRLFSDSIALADLAIIPGQASLGTMFLILGSYIDMGIK